MVREHQPGVLPAFPGREPLAGLDVAGLGGDALVELGVQVAELVDDGKVTGSSSAAGSSGTAARGSRQYGMPATAPPKDPAGTCAEVTPAKICSYSTPCWPPTAMMLAAISSTHFRSAQSAAPGRRRAWPGRQRRRCTRASSMNRSASRSRCSAMPTPSAALTTHGPGAVMVRNAHGVTVPASSG
jgi:hypothetical protein